MCFRPNTIHTRQRRWQGVTHLFYMTWPDRACTCIHHNMDNQRLEKVDCLQCRIGVIQVICRICVQVIVHWIFVSCGRHDTLIPEVLKCPGPRPCFTLIGVTVATSAEVTDSGLASTDCVSAAMSGGTGILASTVVPTTSIPLTTTGCSSCCAVMSPTWPGDFSFLDLAPGTFTKSGSSLLISRVCVSCVVLVVGLAGSGGDVVGGLSPPPCAGTGNFLCTASCGESSLATDWCTGVVLLAPLTRAGWTWPWPRSHWPFCREEDEPLYSDSEDTLLLLLLFWPCSDFLRTRRRLSGLLLFLSLVPSGLGGTYLLLYPPTEQLSRR